MFDLKVFCEADPPRDFPAPRDLANERRQFGYRRLFVLLRREAEPSGINRTYRLYREEGLTVRKRKAGAQSGRNTGPNPGRGTAQCASVAGFRQ